MDSSELTRRNFLRLSAMTAVGIAASACAQPTAVVVEKTVVVEKEVEKTVVVEKEVVKEVEKVVTPTAAPSMYREGSDLAEMVAAGKLPPVDERLPVDPLVLQPIHGLGQHGGTIRSMIGRWEGSISEWMYGPSPIRWVDDGLAIEAMLCDEWSTNEDNSEWTFHIRKGLKWSDGAPVTVDDVIFWWEDLALNPDHSDVLPDYCTADNQVAEFVKVDDFSLVIRYVTSAPLTAMYWANFVNGGIGPRWMAPKDYLKQFHPTYDPEVPTFEELDQKMVWRNNPECPGVTSWITESYEADVRRVMIRNPYYYAVDTEGAQLPYIDGIDQIAMQDPEVQKLAIMQGDIDFVERNNHRIALADLGTMKANEEQGNYVSHLRDGGDGTGRIFFWNHDHPDPKTRELFRNPKFKQAMSYAHDRPTIQKIVYYGTGEQTTGTMSPKAVEFRFNDEAKSVYQETRDAYVEYDPDKAMAILDEIGVVDVDGDGWREFPDGSKLEVLLDLSSTPTPDGAKVTEIAAETWRAIGLNAIINQITASEYSLRWNSGQGHIRCDWEAGDGPNFWVYPSWVVPNEPTRQWPLSGRRLQMVGTEKEDTELDVDPWERQPPRFASTERDLIDSLPGDPVWTLQEIYLAAKIEVDEIQRHHYAWDICRIHVEYGPYMLGCVANTPTLTFCSKDIINCPAHEDLALGGFAYPWIMPHPALHMLETWAFTNL